MLVCKRVVRRRRGRRDGGDLRSELDLCLSCNAHPLLSNICVSGCHLRSSLMHIIHGSTD